MEVEIIQNKIYEIRGWRVMLDFDLACLYEVPTKALKQAVRRNIERFPGDFMFELSVDEYNSLKLNIRSQSVTLESDNEDGRGKYPKYSPFAFTEHGVTMLASVLRSDIAVNISIQIVRAFVALRQLVSTSVEIRQLALENAEIRAKLALLERNDEDTLEAVNDLSEDLRKDIDNLYNAIGVLSVKPAQAEKPYKPIGFKK